jgi:hypothetical protein
VPAVKAGAHAGTAAAATVGEHAFHVTELIAGAIAGARPGNAPPRMGWREIVATVRTLAPGAGT